VGELHASLQVDLAQLRSQLQQLQAEQAKTDARAAAAERRADAARRRVTEVDAEVERVERRLLAVAKNVAKSATKGAIGAGVAGGLANIGLEAGDITTLSGFLSSTVQSTGAGLTFGGVPGALVGITTSTIHGLVANVKNLFDRVTRSEKMAEKSREELERLRESLEQGEERFQRALQESLDLIRFRAQEEAKELDYRTSAYVE